MATKTNEGQRYELPPLVADRLKAYREMRDGWIAMELSHENAGEVQKARLDAEQQAIWLAEAVVAAFPPDPETTVE